MTVCIEEKYRNMFECLKVVYDDKENYGYKEALTYVFYDKEREKLVTTNGKSMLFYVVTPELKEFLSQFENPFFRYERGYLTDYKLDKDFVSWWRVVPSNPERLISETEIKYNSLIFRKGDKDIHYFNYAYAMKQGIYNFKYFKKLDIRFDKVKHYKSGDCIICLFENKLATFLIVNIREA